MNVENLHLKHGQVALHWYGQCSFSLLDDQGTLIFIDPYFPLWRPQSEFIHPESPIDESKISASAVFVSHDHRDHNCPDSLLRFLLANSKLDFFGTKDAQTRWGNCRIPPERCNAITLGDQIVVESMTVKATSAKPPTGCPEAGIAAPDTEHLGFVVDAGTKRFYFSGDTVNNFADRPDLIDPIAQLKPDVAILTMHPTEGEFPFFRDGWEIAAKIGARTVIPCHYDCFVKRTYDPCEFAELAPLGIQPLILPYNTTHIFS